MKSLLYAVIRVQREAWAFKPDSYADSAKTYQAFERTETAANAMWRGFSEAT
jgi:hypothetical protein